ncbi:hypothetical protein SEA_SPOOKY_100 [Gordonia phage Spooky]|nr:hypothetical protein SEA_SPOOKY_100 [Gordonia phage Spooky]
MSELDLDAIEARAANAPKGRQQVSDGLVRLEDDAGRLIAVWRREFVTEARPDILALVSRVRELEAREKRVLEVVEWVEGVASEISSVADDQVGQSIVEAYRTITTQVRAELGDPS